MLSWFARAACLAFVMAAGPALADDLADFNAAVEAAAAHNRVAIGYLRTGNVDLASLEIDRLRAAWGKLHERFDGKRPDIFDGNQYYIVAMTDIATRLITADMMLNTGHGEVTQQALLAIRSDLYKLRKSAGIVVLADCVYDANNAMDALMGFNNREIEWSNAETRSAIAGEALGLRLGARALRRHRRRRCANRIPPPDRWRQSQPDIDPQSHRHPRQRSVASRADRIALVRQFAGLPLRLTPHRHIPACDTYSLIQPVFPAKRTREQVGEQTAKPKLFSRAVMLGAILL